MLRNLQKWAQRTALGIGLMSSIYGCGSNNPKNNQITYVPVVEAHVEEEPKEKKVDKLDQLAAIINSVDEAKAYLLSVGYDFEDSNLDDEKSNKSDPPRVSIEDGKAHCFEAVLQVAYFLEDDGFEPLLLTMYTKDKGHSIFLYKENGLYGSIAKSRLKTLESREAVF